MNDQPINRTAIIRNIIFGWIQNVILFILIVGFPILVAVALMWSTDTGLFAPEATPTPIVTPTGE